MSNERRQIWAENDMSQKHRIVEDRKREGNARACIYDQAEFILKLYEAYRERYVKKVVGYCL